MARLDGTTGAADAFDPNNIGVVSISIQADGKVLVGGVFSMIGGQPRTGIARLDSGSGMADSFQADADDDLESIALQSDGKIIVDFLHYYRRSAAQSPRPTDKRYPGISTLTASQTTITLLRAGAVPQFARAASNSPQTTARPILSWVTPQPNLLPIP